MVFELHFGGEGSNPRLVDEFHYTVVAIPPAPEAVASELTM